MTIKKILFLALDVAIVAFAALNLAILEKPLPVHAQSGGDLSVCAQSPSALKSGDHEVITVSSTAVGFTAAKLFPTTGAPKPVCAVVQVISNSVSYWGAFAAPTAADGLVIPTNASVAVGPNDLNTFRMIRVTSDASVMVQYYVPVS